MKYLEKSVWVFDPKLLTRSGCYGYLEKKNADANMSTKRRPAKLRSTITPTFSPRGRTWKVWCTPLLIEIKWFVQRNSKCFHATYSVTAQANWALFKQLRFLFPVFELWTNLSHALIFEWNFIHSEFLHQTNVPSKVSSTSKGSKFESIKWTFSICLRKAENRKETILYYISNSE